METFIQSLEATLSGFLGTLPTIFKVLLVLFVGWLISRGLSRTTKKLLNKTQWDEHFLGKAIAGDTNKFAANLVYYLLMIIVLMIALEMMGVSEVLDPLKQMMSEFFGFVPNLVAAGILVFIGLILSKFVSHLVSIGGNILDRFVDKTGFKDTKRLVEIIRQVVFLIIFIPFIIFALNALNLEAISQPANSILSDILTIIPRLLAAAAIIALFVIGGKFLTGLLKNLLESLGIDNAAEKLYLSTAIGDSQSLSAILANVAYFFLAFFGVITGVELLGLDQLTNVLQDLLYLSGQIVFGVVILVIGNFISRMVADLIAKGEGNQFVATVVRVATLGLFLAMALRAMDIAPDIVNLAFGLTFGSVAVVVALAYGLGGREAAGDHFREIIQKFRSKR